MKRKIISVMVLAILATSLMAANMKVAILDFAKKDRNSDYVAKSMMKRDFKNIFKDVDDLDLIDLKKSQSMASKSGYSNLFFAGIEDIKAMGAELGADVVVWGEVQEKSPENFKIVAKILSMKSNDVVQVSFDVTKASKPRQKALIENLVKKIQDFSGGEIEKVYGIATQYFNSKNYESAEESFLSLINIDPENIDGYFYLGLIKFINKDYEASVEYYAKGLEIDPENIDLYNYQSKSYVKLGDVEAAAESLKKITELKEDKEIWLRIGDLYAEMEYYDEATEAYDAAIEIDSEYGEAHRQLAILYYNQELYDDAIEPFECATKAFPDDDDLQKKIAKCYNKTGKIEDAIKQYVSILAEQKDNVKAYMNLVNAYFVTENFEKALETSEALLKITPENPKSLILVANAQNSLKKYGLAKKSAEAAIAIDGDLYQPYRILSEINFSRGYIKYERFLKLEEDAKTVYGEEADRLIDERDKAKKDANDYFQVSQKYLDTAKTKTESSSELRYIKSKTVTIKQLLKATEKGFF